MFVAACGGAAATPTTAANSTAAPTVGIPPTPAVATVAPTANAPAPSAAARNGPPAASTPVASTPTAKDPGVFTSPDPNPRRGDTLHLAFGVTTSNYDLQQGASASVLCHLYNQLVRLNQVDGLHTIVQDVAEKFDIAADGLTYTFQLRSGVPFHDGTPLTADDVVATYNRMIFLPQRIVSLLKDRFSVGSKVEATDLLTVKFTLTQPSPILLLVMTDTTQAISAK